MRRLVLVLTLAGAALLAAGSFYVIFDVGFICYDSCPPESGLAAALGERIAGSAPALLPGALLLTGAWGVCLVALTRSRRWLSLAAVFLALPASVALALGAMLAGTDGKLLPTTWYEHNAGWSAALPLAALLLLLWPLAILLASFALRRG